MKKWEPNTNYDFKNKKFAKIYSFFVIETPVEDVSQRGISFKKRNINMNALCSQIKKISKPLNIGWKMETNQNVINILKDNGLLQDIDIPHEIAIHTERSNIGKTASLFYCIRCALAHGGFNIYKYKNEKYYFLENKDKGKLKGRVILKEKTLLKIIDYCENKVI